MPRSTSFKNRKVDWQPAPDIQKKIKKLVASLDLDWIEIENIHCFRSKKSKTRAQARIWGLSRIWQQALNQKPSYIIEVISERFDQLAERRQEQVLLHELAHIPKNFSGALFPHTRRGKGNFHSKLKRMLQEYLKK